VLVHFNLSVATNTSSEAGVRNNLSVLSALLKVVDGSVEFLSLHRLGYVVGVLEVNAEVRNLAFGGFSGFRRLS